MEEHPELSPGEATKRAMAEITAPIIAITLVLLVGVRAGRVHSRHLRRIVPAIRGHGRGVDVPLGDQCADAFAGAVRRVAAAASRAAPRRDGYGDALDRLGCATPTGPRSRASFAFRSSGLPWWRSRRLASSGSPRSTPTGFLPEDDQGALFVVVQLPGGASVARTTDVVQQAEAILKEEHAVADYTSVDRLELHRQLFAAECRRSWWSRSNRSRNARTRPQSVRSLDRSARREIPTDPGRPVVVPLAPPPIIGLGTGGGFSYVLEDLRGGDPKTLAQALRGLVVAANQDPQPRRRLQRRSRRPIRRSISISIATRPRSSACR